MRILWFRLSGNLLLLGLAPGVLFAQNKHKPVDVNPFVKATIEETRGTHKQNFGNLPESTVVSTEHVFIQNSVTVSGSSYLNWNSDSLQFETNGNVDGLEETKMVIIADGVARQSTMSELANGIPRKYNLWTDFNADIRKYNPETDDYDRVLALNSTVSDAVEVDGNLYYVRYNVLYDQTRQPLHTLTAAEGNFHRVIDGGDGNLYLYALDVGIGGYDRNHGFFQYNLSTGTMTLLASFNTDELDFAGAIIGFINGKLQIVFSSAHVNFNKTVWYELDGSNLKTIAEFDGQVATDFAVAVDDGRIRAAFMMPDDDEAMTLDQAVAPTITGSAAPISIVEDNTGTTNLSDITNNPDDIKQYISSDNPDLGTVEINGNTLTFIPFPDAYGSATITITVAEVLGGPTTETTVLVTVTPENDNPTANTDSETITVPENSLNQSIDLDTHFSDVDGDHMTYSITDQPDPSTGVTGTMTGSIFDVSFADNVFGTFTFVVQADDGNGGTGSKTFNFERTVDQPPQLVGDIDDMNISVDDDECVVPAAEINNLYDDPDSDNANFEFRPSSSDGTVVTATMNEAGDLVISPQSVGTAKITLNMTSNGRSPQDVAEFIVTVTQASSNDVEDDTKGFAIANYPNPVPRGDVVNFQFNVKETTETYMEVFNLLGQRIWQQTITSGSGKNRIQIPTRGWAAGRYFFRVYSELDGRTNITVKPFTVIKR